jgi:hypothetical protein
MTKSVAIRIGVDGKAEFKRDVEEATQAGASGFERLGKAIDDGTAAIDRQKRQFDNLAEAQRRAQIQTANQNAFNTALGIDKPSAGSAQASAQAFIARFEELDRIAQLKAQQIGGHFQAALNESLGIGGPSKSARDSAAIFEAQARAEEDMAVRAATLRAELDPLGAAQIKLNAAMASANELAAAGAITDTERAAAIALAEKGFKETEVALKAMSGAAALGTTQQMALMHSVRGSAEMLAQGVSPVQIMAMELNNLSYAASGPGGVGAVFRFIGSTVGSFLVSPLGLAAIAFTTLGAAAYAGAARAEVAEHQLTEATTFAARAIGLSREEVEAFAESAASADHISTAAAREIEVAFAKTGVVSGQSLTGLIALTKEFADKTGHSLSEAEDMLSKAFADPAKDGAELLKTLGGLDDKTRDYLTSLEKAGRLTDAQRVLESELTKVLKDATDQTTWYGDAWHWVASKFSEAAEALSHGFRPVALQTQRDQLLQELDLARKGVGLTSFDPETHRSTKLPARSIADIEADIKRVNAEIDGTRDKAKQSADDAAAQALSLRAGPLVRAIDPSATDLKGLKANKDVLDSLVGNTLALSKLGATQDQARGAQDAYTRAVESYISPAERAHQLSLLDIKALNDKTPAQKRATAEERERLELAGQAIPVAEANRRVQDAGAKAYAESAHQVREHASALRESAIAWLSVADAYLQDSAAGERAEAATKKLNDQVDHAAVDGAKRVAQLRDETSARKALNDAVADGHMSASDASREMSIQAELAPLLVAESLAEGDAKKELAKVIAALTAARRADNAEDDRSRAQGEIETQDRNLDLLRAQIALAGEADDKREADLALLDEKTRLLEMHIGLETEEGRKLIENALAASHLKQELELAGASRAEIERMFDDVGSKFVDFIAQGKYGWSEFEQFALSALQDIESEMIKLALLNPLKNMLFGTNLPTLDSMGGFFGSLFSDSGGAGVGKFGVGHVGMTAGFASASRDLPLDVLSVAPRFHDGIDLSDYLGPNEVPAVLERGEIVLNQREAREYRRGNSGGGVTVMPGAVVIQASDPSAFRASTGQIMTSITRAVQHGMRNL